MYIQGILATVISAMLFGATPVIVSKVYSYGATPETVTFYRSLFAAVMLLALCGIRREGARFTGRQLGAIAGTGVLVVFTTLLLYSSYDYISVGTATTLHFTYPVFVVAGCRLFGEKIGKIRGAALTAACVGMAFFLEPDGKGSMIGITLSVASGVTYALYMIMLDKLNLKQIPAFVLSAAIAVVGCIALLIYELAVQRIVYLLPLYAYLLIGIIALFTSVLAVVLLQLGIRILGAGTASILCTFEPLTSIVFGYLFLDEVLTARSILGSVIILSAVVTLSSGERMREQTGTQGEALE